MVLHLEKTQLTKESLMNQAMKTKTEKLVFTIRKVTMMMIVMMILM